MHLSFSPKLTARCWRSIPIGSIRVARRAGLAGIHRRRAGNKTCLRRSAASGRNRSRKPAAFERNLAGCPGTRIYCVSLAVFGSVIRVDPAFRYGGPRISVALRTTGRTSSISRERRRARNVLVIARPLGLRVKCLWRGSLPTGTRSMRNKRRIPATSRRCACSSMFLPNSSTRWARASLRDGSSHGPTFTGSDQWRWSPRISPANCGTRSEASGRAPKAFSTRYDKRFGR